MSNTEPSNNSDISPTPPYTTQQDREDDEQLMKKIRFRNYRPRTESLKKYIEETDAANKDWETWEAQFEAEMADAELKFANPDTDLDILAPKKINWDLKMQFEPKQRLLQRQTHKALLEIVREKVTANGARQGEQLAQAVAQAQSVASDDEEAEDENDVDV